MRINTAITIVVLDIVISVSGFAQEKPKDWFNEEFELSTARGISIDHFYDIIDSTDLEKVVVAVIDNGVDIYHEDLKHAIWVNDGEVADNQIDDDHNGYIDDVNGWNYLGNPSGENVNHANLEITRLYRFYSKKFDSVNVDTLSANDIEDFVQFKEIENAFEKETRKIKKQFEEYSQLAALYSGAMSYMEKKFGTSEFTINELLSYETESLDEKQVIEFLLMAEKEGLSEYLKDGESYFDNALNYHYNIDFNPRAIVNEAILDSAGVMYGNNQVWASKPDHGTHVAGIIAANRNNDIGISGIATNALIMPLRAVPDGDERDEDIARAILYAADNGAQIINMSFGKKYSPNSKMVEDAIDYALSKDILLIHAAGNEAVNIDEEFHYPRGIKKNNKSKKGFLTVGAHTMKDSTYILADFSNYGGKSVDILAPGEDIYSTISGNEYKRYSGTSMAAPVVSGLAAIYRGKYPDKSAQQIKKLIQKSLLKYKNIKTKIDEDKVELKSVVRHPGFLDIRRVFD